MTQPLCRPLLAAVSSRSPTLCLSRRCLLSTSAHLLYPPSASAKSKMQRRAQPPGPSLRVLSKAGGQVPLDIGLLDGTFITPTTPSKRPSPLSHPLRYLKLQFTILKLRLRDRLSLQILRFASPALSSSSWFKRKISTSRTGLAATATGLHVQMYTAFAAADKNTLRDICLHGIMEELYTRIEKRDRAERVTWELVRYQGRPKLVSDRAARMPIEGMAVRQAVVRVDSVQKLTRWRRVAGARGEGEREVVVAGSGVERVKREYVVIQRRAEGWVEGEWKVWGTTGENTLEDFEKWQGRVLG